MNTESKVTSEHLKRSAYLYIRQSTLRQVIENTESAKRQYALRQRAMALGWSEERIIVIDNDQAHSGALGRFGRRPPRVPTLGERSRLGQGGDRHGIGGFPLGAQLRRLASSSGDMRLDSCAHPG